MRHQQGQRLSGTMTDAPVKGAGWSGIQSISVRSMMRGTMYMVGFKEQENIKPSTMINYALLTPNDNLLTSIHLRMGFP